ncbi:ABC transporter permease [Telmatospirillum sp.]|uniref:ABC transporter permease n=1 Tax=Telmatospirillum sp. TaxID=2079197 RepID=UPI00284F8DD2|nr:ABC transporter permease [Telmatospirillum sp.]MDR3437404.1 ABC transporter permease [Telmatospirillum sp.]
MTVADPIETRRDLSPDRPAWLRLPRFARIPTSLALAWLIIAIAAAWSLAPDLFTAYSGTAGLALQHRLPPGGVHWLGTDELGRDVLARIIFGSVHTLSGAFVAVGVGLVAGTLLGLIAGSAGRLADDIIMRMVDVLLAVPALLLSLSIIILLGFGTINAAIAVGVSSVASFARLARSEVARVRTADYVEAAFGSGGSVLAVLWRHVLPNALTPVMALAALQFGSAILSISTLGFLGYGAQPPMPEWGLMIAEGRRYIATAWWMSIFPGVAVVIVVLATNRISLSLRGRPD